MHLVDATMFFCDTSGGVKRYLTAKRQWLMRESGIRHSLLVPGPGKTDDTTESLYRIRGVPIPFSDGYRFPILVGDAAEKFRAMKPDLIEAGDPYTLAWGALRAGRELGVPVVGFYHSDLPRLIGARFGRFGERMAEAYVARLYAQFDLVLAPSRAMVNGLHALGISAARHQPLGVDTALFHPYGSRIDLRTQLKLPPDSKLLVYAGRFAREKNIPWLFQALRLLGPMYHLIIVGGEHVSKCPSNVTILPYMADSSHLAKLLASCDAFVHAGDRETFGLAVLEAMACGIPVVGMASGGVAELVPAGCGVLVEPKGGAAIAQGIDMLFASNTRAMGTLARSHVCRHYAWERVFSALIAHYRNLRSTSGLAMPAVDAPLEIAHARD